MLIYYLRILSYIYIKLFRVATIINILNQSYQKSENYPKLRKMKEESVIIPTAMVSWELDMPATYSIPPGYPFHNHSIPILII